MSKWLIIGGIVATFVVGIIFAIILGVWYFSTSNKEIALRNQIEAKQADNKNVYDSTWKQISQCAQVTDAQKQALLEIVTGYAKARTGNGGGSLATMVTEVVPNMDTSTFNQLMNIITSARTRFDRVQTEILDLNREHNNCIDLFPGSIVCGGRPKIKIELVTSSRTEGAFESGKDDDVQVFQKPQAPKPVVPLQVERK
jgi:hypothetical protein